MLASVGGIAIIAVVNTWRLYALPATLTVVFGAMSGTIFVAGLGFLIIGMKGKTRGHRSGLAGWVLIAAILFEMVLLYVYGLIR